MPELPDGEVVPAGGPLADLPPSSRAQLPSSSSAKIWPSSRAKPPPSPDAQPAPFPDAQPPSSSCAQSQDPEPPPFSLYIHVPYCSVRCGYCDFNTYTARELGGGASQANYADSAIREVELAAAHLERADRAPGAVRTVFFGGGTPTILPAADLARMLAAVDRTWGLASGAEVTTEANPDTLDQRYVDALAAAGFTRISVGMQSAVPHVLATLERTHSPENVARAVTAAKTAGLQVSVDLIYGTPGESVADWETSVRTAVALEPDHISAYALGIEPGTKMGAQLRRGEIVEQDPNELAEKYELADDLLAEAGYSWYEISNWSRGTGTRCEHNMAYWRGSNWWGIGPGAHSHVDGVRWWNVKHPRPYAARVEAAEIPAVGREVLSDAEREFERIMLAVRLAEGLEPPLVERSRSQDDAWKRLVSALAAEGLADPVAAARGVVVLTRNGRLQADAVTRRLTEL